MGTIFYLKKLDLRNATFGKLFKFSKRITQLQVKLYKTKRINQKKQIEKTFIQQIFITFVHS